MAKTAAVLSNSHPPLRTVHLKFQGTGVNDAQISISSPDQPRNEPPMTISYGVRKYKVASSTLRGRWRRQIAVEEIEARIDAIDRTAVESVAQSVLSPETRGLCVLGPLTAGSIRFPAPRAA